MQKLRDRVLRELGRYPDLNHPLFGPSIPFFLKLPRALKQAGVRSPSGPAMALSMAIHLWMIEASHSDTVDWIAYGDDELAVERFCPRLINPLIRAGCFEIDKKQRLFRLDETAVIRLFDSVPDRVDD